MHFKAKTGAKLKSL